MQEFLCLCFAKKAFKVTIHHGVSLIDRISITFVYSVRRYTTEPLNFAGFGHVKFQDFLCVHSLSVGNSGDLFLSLYLPRVGKKLPFKMVYRLVYRAPCHAILTTKHTFILQKHFIRHSRDLNCVSVERPKYCRLNRVCMAIFYVAIR